MRSQSERRGGQYGNTRGKERQARRTRRRMETPRITSRLSQAQQEQAELDRLIEQQRRNPAQGKTEGAEYAERRREAEEREQRRQREREEARLRRSLFKPCDHTFMLPVILLPLPDARGHGWTLQQARTMLKQGYLPEVVAKRTGWGMSWLDDIPLSESGHGMRNG